MEFILDFKMSPHFIVEEKKQDKVDNGDTSEHNFLAKLCKIQTLMKNENCC